MFIGSFFFKIKNKYKMLFTKYHQSTNKKNLYANNLRIKFRNILLNYFFLKKDLTHIFTNITFIFIKLLYKKSILSIYTRLIFLGLIYVGDVPLGIKQNTVIKESLNLIFNVLLDLQIFFQKNFYLIFIILNQDIVFIKLSIMFAFSIYNLLINVIIDILELFRGKTFNKLKKRYDSVELTIDQIILSVLLFSISILVYINVIIYYIKYIIVYIVFVILLIAENLIFLSIYKLLGKKNLKESINLYDFLVYNLCKKLNIKNIFLGKINMKY